MLMAGMRTSCTPAPRCAHPPPARKVACIAHDPDPSWPLDDSWILTRDQLPTKKHKKMSTSLID
eukprot:GDKH01003730.1.p2 GENE.GDKH01003730.1~~GDKH01003730.1.p2  ORF type:complete len:64 (+),score=1.11 GDKH01003730.1:144-335(+)